MVRLTNDNVRTLPAKGVDVLYPDDETPHFYLRVREGGSRTFLIQWRQGQVQRRSTVGKVGVYSLDEARRKARKLLVDIDNGTDPIARRPRPASTTGSCSASWRPNISTSAAETCGRAVSNSARCIC